MQKSGIRIPDECGVRMT